MEKDLFSQSQLIDLLASLMLLNRILDIHELLLNPRWFVCHWGAFKIEENELNIKAVILDGHLMVYAGAYNF